MIYNKNTMELVTFKDVDYMVDYTYAATNILGDIAPRTGPGVKIHKIHYKGVDVTPIFDSNNPYELIKEDFDNETAYYDGVDVNEMWEIFTVNRSMMNELEQQIILNHEAR